MSDGIDYTQTSDTEFLTQAFNLLIEEMNLLGVSDKDNFTDRCVEYIRVITENGLAKQCYIPVNITALNFLRVKIQSLTRVNEMNKKKARQYAELCCALKHKEDSRWTSRIRKWLALKKR